MKKKIKINAKAFVLAGLTGIFGTFALIAEEMTTVLDEDAFDGDEFSEMKENFRICKANFDEGLERMRSILRDRFDLIEGK